MGKLLDAVTAETRQQGPRCGLWKLLQPGCLPKDIRADLVAALDSASPSTAIARGLGQFGHRIAPSTVQTHRRGDCGCGRTS